jgi:hypothetical protein
MLNVFGLYLAVAGGVAAGAQVARGAVRGASRLVRGDPRGAAVEVAGGVAAPVVSAVHQLSRLGGDVCQAVASLTAEVRAKARPGGAPVPPTSPPRRRRSPAAAPTVPANGAA